MQQLEELRQCLSHANAIMVQLLKQQDNPMTNPQEQPKDYEILAFRATDKHQMCDGQVYKVVSGITNIVAYINSSAWEIYQVKRLSDGAVWALGDTTQYGNILSFILTDATVAVHCDNDSAVISLRTLESSTGWEIIEFRNASSKGHESAWVITDGGYKPFGDYKHFKTPLLLQQALAHVDDGEFIIWSVRRLSDGQVFTVGDKCTLTEIQNAANIDRFTILNDKVMAVFYDIEYDLNLLIKVLDVPTFITADGVIVKEGDTVWYATDCFAPSVNKAKSELQWNNIYSTKEAAYKAWLYAQPVLCINDIDGCSFDEVVDVVKSKLSAQ